MLSQQGHDVSIILTSYKNEPSERTIKHDIKWFSISASIGANKHNILTYWNKLNKIVSIEKPDWIIGFSDIWYGILASKLAKKYNCKYLVDAYDNYESYIPWALPFHWLWRKSLKHADIVTAAGPGLADLLSKNRQKKAEVIPMAADSCFFPMDKEKCRKNLGLPANNKIIGYSGSIYNSRGINDLFRIYEEIAKNSPDTALVLSGRKDKDINLPDGAIYLGYIEDDKMPELVNCYDVLAVVNQPSSFGDYSYPSKLYEAMASKIPVIASDTPSIKWILQDNNCIVDFSDTNSAKLKLEQALQLEDEPEYIRNSSWELCAHYLNELLNSS